MIVPSYGIPFYNRQNYNDIDWIKRLPVDLPEESQLLDDSAYTDYLFDNTLTDIIFI
ncbi:MAG: hypothetical protein LBQ74_02790 [Prevotella sp.]|jgi:hypothetical protein|nr:hypothetical protein [Prevotella sp.]